MMAVIAPPKRSKTNTPSKMDELKSRVQKARQAAVWHHEQRALEKTAKRTNVGGKLKVTSNQSSIPNTKIGEHLTSQIHSNSGSAIHELIDFNGAYVEAKTHIPRSRVWAMSFLGVCIGTALILIVSPLLGSSGGEARIFASDKEQKSSFNAAQSTVKQTNTIFPYDPNSPSNDFQVFAMPMKARKVASTTQEIGSIRNNLKKNNLEMRQFTPQRIIRSSEVITASAAMTSRTVCVRMCDGYFFPLSNHTNGSNLHAQEAMCSAACPASTTKLFTLAAGNEVIDQAVSLKGVNYTATSMAYAYEKGVDKTCSCQIANDARQTYIQTASLKPSTTTATDAVYNPSPTADGKRVTPFNDPTLQLGDAVVNDGSAKVFIGKVGGKLVKEDFIDFRTTKTLSQLDKNKLDQTVGVSRQEALYKQIQNTKRILDKTTTILNSDGTPVAGQNSSRKDRVSQNDVIIKSETSTGKRQNVRVISLKLPNETSAAVEKKQP